MSARCERGGVFFESEYDVLPQTISSGRRSEPSLIGTNHEITPCITSQYTLWKEIHPIRKRPGYAPSVVPSGGILL